jgi:hypothetical protein
MTNRHHLARISGKHTALDLQRKSHTWLAPLPPGRNVYSGANTVSPGFGSFGGRIVRSTVKEPNTITVGGSIRGSVAGVVTV